MPFHGLGLELPYAALLGGAVMTPPAGFVFLVDYDGFYLTDADGSYLIEEV